MVNRASIHALVDDLAEEQLELAKKALEEIRGFDVSEEDRRELLEREVACDRGNGIARAFLQRLRRGPPIPAVEFSRRAAREIERAITCG